MMQRLTREQAAIIGAFTGYAAGPFEDIHEYAERKLGRQIWTHQFPAISSELRKVAREDFVAIATTRD